MLDIVDNRIYLTRGDTASIDIRLTDATGGDYEPVAGDKIYFRLKNAVFGNTLRLVKEISPTTLTLALSEADTANLELGTYRYEVELVTSSGDRFTVIENGEFVLGVELESHDG